SCRKTRATRREGPHRGCLSGGRGRTLATGNPAGNRGGGARRRGALLAAERGNLFSLRRRPPPARTRTGAGTFLFFASGPRPAHRSRRHGRPHRRKARRVSAIRSRGFRLKESRRLIAEAVAAL